MIETKEDEMKINLKQRRGITLIALVITIVVLLILAGVTIAMLTGENGILGKATTAKAKSAEEEARERVNLMLADWKMENAIPRNTPYLGINLVESSTAPIPSIKSVPCTIFLARFTTPAISMEFTLSCRFSRCFNPIFFFRIIDIYTPMVMNPSPPI